MDTRHPPGWFVLLMHGICWPAVIVLSDHNLADFAVGFCLGVLTFWWWLGHDGQIRSHEEWMTARHGPLPDEDGL